MSQMLLIPDPRPLDERLGGDFFRQAPHCPGVYLMKDAADRVLYVGKAKDLNQRLSHYRAANPDRMPRRHLRLVNQVSRIELQFCDSESAALKRETKLIRSLKPKFNRVGVWPGRPRFITWRVEGDQLQITVVETPTVGWQRFGPLGGGALPLQRTIARLLWLALNPDRPLAQLPLGWMTRHSRDFHATLRSTLAGEAAAAMEAFFWDSVDEFLPWLETRLTGRPQPFERGVIDSELEILQEFGARNRANQNRANQKGRNQLALL
jgi:predicted GIY-YIG superfamily endonuclease